MLTGPFTIYPETSPQGRIELHRKSPLFPRPVDQAQSWKLLQLAQDTRIDGELPNFTGLRIYAQF